MDSSSTEGRRWIGRSIHFSALLMAVLSLCSCMEDNAEVWLNEDGSGRVRNAVIFKGASAMMFTESPGMNLSSMKAQAFIDGQDGIHLISASTTKEIPDLPEDKEALSQKEKEALQEKIRVVHEVEYEFDSVEALRNLKMFDAKAYKGGSETPGILMELKSQEDHSLKWRSEIEGPTVTGMSDTDLFKGAVSTMRVHFPSPIVESNANEVSDDNLTGTWKIQMDTIINDIAPLNATLAPLERSWMVGIRATTFLVGVSALGVVLLAALAFFMGRNSKRA
ncbi:MAG: hypothetical protein AAGJ31_14090 [Verrucomicrobiota bacterium]